MKKTTPTVSVIIPAFRSEKTIERAITSVALCEGLDVEIIVVEDGVYDSTSEVVNKFPQVIFLSNEKNLGAPAARNRGLNIARGEFVIFLDADDYVEPPLLESLVDILRQEKTNIAFGPWQKRGEHFPNHPLTIPPRKSASSWLASWLVGEFVPTCAVMWSRSELIALNGWDESIKKNQDGDLAMRAFMRNNVPSIATKGCGIYFQHNSPYRITSSSATAINESHKVIYNKIDDWLNKNPDTEVKSSLGLFAYKTAQVMYIENQFLLGESWIKIARNTGLNNHPGTLPHQLLANIFGIKNKEIISRRLRGILQAARRDKF